MVDWSFFRNKRRLDVTQWLVKLNLLTYTDFSKALLALGVNPPSEDIYNSLVKDIKQSAEIPVDVVEKSLQPTVKPALPKKAVKKRVRKSQKEPAALEDENE